VKSNKLIALLSIWLLALTCLYLYGFTYTIDTATPVGTDAPSVIDDRIRQAKAGWQERMNVDHVFALTGTEVSAANTGQHRQVEFDSPITKPTSATNKSWLYAKDVSAKAELHWEDEDGDEIQFTSGGVFNIGLLTSTTITTPTLTSPVLNTGVSGTAVLDEDDMTSDSATKLATQQSIKKYVDDNVGSANYTPTSYTGGESVTFPNGLIIKSGYDASVTASSTEAKTFSTAFPNGVVSAIANVEHTAPLGGNTNIYISSLSKTGFTAVNDNDDNGQAVGYYWMAIGY